MLWNFPSSHSQYIPDTFVYWSSGNFQRPLPLLAQSKAVPLIKWNVFASTRAYQSVSRWRNDFVPLEVHALIRSLEVTSYDSLTTSTPLLAIHQRHVSLPRANLSLRVECRTNCRSANPSVSRSKAIISSKPTIIKKQYIFIFKIYY